MRMSKSQTVLEMFLLSIMCPVFSFRINYPVNYRSGHLISFCEITDNAYLSSVWNNLLYVVDFIGYRNYFTLHKSSSLKMPSFPDNVEFPFVSLHVLKKTSLTSVKRVGEFSLICCTSMAHAGNT